MAQKRSTSRKKIEITWIHVFFFIITLGIAYYLYAKNNEKKTDTDPGNKTINTPRSSTAGTIVKKPTFPLELYSYSEFVTSLQNKLNDVFSAGIGKFGYLGDLTAKVLKDNGFALPLSKMDYDKILSMTKSFAKISADLHTAISKRDFNMALNTLKSISSVSDYTEANKFFILTKSSSVFFKTSIVTGLLETFGDATVVPNSAGNRSLIETEFLRIGLKKQGTKWSLSGV